MTLGERDEASARERGAMDAASGRPMNPHWLGRREGVADAYRAGYARQRHLDNARGHQADVFLSADDFQKGN